jgi:DNA-directed RNA polymerase subunit RPC12/RpoP
VAFNIAPFVVYNLTRPKKREEEKTVEIKNCPQCGEKLSSMCPTVEVCDDKVTVTTEYFCFECDESVFTERTGKIMWD